MLTAERANDVDFGGMLREARTRRGITLRQIADATKIPVTMLTALERNDTSRLPGGIFSRAFVRSYALEVGLDPDDTVERFIAAAGWEPESTAQQHSLADPANDEIESDRRIASAILGLVAISVPIAAFVLHFGFTGRQSAPLERAPVVGVAAERRPAAAAAPLVIVVQASRPSWVSAAIDGEAPVAHQLRVGERQTFGARRDMLLRVGDGAAVSWTVNGAEGRPFGSGGDATTAHVTLENFMSYLSRQ